MTIGGVDVGYRKRPVTDEPGRVTSYGISMAGVSQQYDFALNNQRVEIVLPYLSTATKNSLKIALESTAKPGGTVSVTPDAWDDLGVSASGATDFIYVSFRAAVVRAGYWEAVVVLRYIA